MSQIDELRKKFIVDEDIVKARLELLVNEALKHCVVDRNGAVHISNSGLASRDKVKLVLVARFLGSQLDKEIAARTTTEELVRSTGLPRAQVRARASELVRERFAETPESGTFIVLPHKIEQFLRTCSSVGTPK